MDYGVRLWLTHCCVILQSMYVFGSLNPQSVHSQVFILDDMRVAVAQPSCTFEELREIHQNGQRSYEGDIADGSGRLILFAFRVFLLLVVTSEWLLCRLLSSVYIDQELTITMTESHGESNQCKCRWWHLAKKEGWQNGGMKERPRTPLENDEWLFFHHLCPHVCHLEYKSVSLVRGTYSLCFFLIEYGVTSNTTVSPLYHTSIKKYIWMIEWTSKGLESEEESRLDKMTKKDAEGLRTLVPSKSSNK